MGNEVKASIVLSDDLLQVIREIFKEESLDNSSMEISEASGKGDNYLGKLYRVTFGRGKNGESFSFIVKCALESEVLRENFPIDILYQREIYAYSKLLPTLYSLQDEYYLPKQNKFYFTKYYGSITEVGKESVIIADLAVDGYKMYNRKNSFDKQHLELVIKNLAQFHATSFVLKQNKPKLFEQFTHNISRKLEYGDNIGKFMVVAKNRCLNIIESAEIRKKIEENLEDFMGKFSTYLDYKYAHPYNAICHGDCWINNFMFKYKDDKVIDVKFIDWQIVRWASPVTDIAYMMFSSTDEQIRSNYYTSSLDLYYETLDKNITMMGCKTTECYPLNVFKDQIRAVMPFGLVAAILLLPTVLSNKEDSPDLDTKPEDFDESIYDNLLSNACKKRLNGVFKDIISSGLI